MAMSLSVLVVIQINSIFGDRTCCYGETCPLPIFNQYVGNISWLMQPLYNVIDEAECCPSRKKISEIVTSGTTVTSCSCSHDQNCPGLQESNGLVCPGYDSTMTDLTCPDCHVSDIDFNNGGKTCLNSDCYCAFTPSGEATRSMTQRCLPTTICVKYAGFIYNGTYYKNGFYNGFPAYYNSYKPSWIRVEPYFSDTSPTWVVSGYDDNSTVTPLDFAFCLKDFNDITSFDYSQCDGNAVYEGECQITTTTSTTTTSTTITQTLTTTIVISTLLPSKSDTLFGLTVVEWVIISISIILGIIIISLVVRRFKNKQPSQSNEVRKSGGSISIK